MANSKRKCANCQQRKPVEGMKITPVMAFCDVECIIQYQRKPDVKEKAKAKIKKEQRKKDKDRLEELTGRGGLYQKLQKLCNQWVNKVRDAEKPCCTCGNENPEIKYDAGHYIAVGQDSAIRFDVTNIHRQCSVYCNQHGRGRPVEYSEFILQKYGQDHLDYLKDKSRHKTLKEQFPTTEDIKSEILRYRGLIRCAGLKPIV